MTAAAPLIVGLGGTTRPGSSSERALVMALEAARGLGAEVALHGGQDLKLPLYDPAEGAAAESARRLIADLRRADGVIVSSPCYHGGVSGLIKNAIDYTEEMRDDPRVYLDGRALGAIGCGFGHQGPATVLSQLRQIAHALRAWNVPLGVAINTAAVKFEAESCSDDAIARQIRIMAAQVVEHARRTNAEK